MEERTPQPEPPRPARTKLTRPGSRLDTGDAMPQTEFYRPDPLAGDRIMDATARLLAPRRTSLTAQRPKLEQEKPAPAGKRRRKKEAPQSAAPARQPEREPQQSQPAQSGQASHKKRKPKKSAPPAGQQERHKSAPRKEEKRRGGRGGRRGMPMEPMKSNQTKDSTEQHSLMKPYSLDF